MNQSQNEIHAFRISRQAGFRRARRRRPSCASTKATCSPARAPHRRDAAAARASTLLTAVRARQDGRALEQLPRSRSRSSSATRPKEVLWFLKPPSSFITHGQPIVYPVAQTESVVLEGELGIVIGKQVQERDRRSKRATASSATPSSTTSPRRTSSSATRRSRSTTAARASTPSACSARASRPKSTR